MEIDVRNLTDVNYPYQYTFLTKDSVMTAGVDLIKEVV